MKALKRPNEGSDRELVAGCLRGEAEAWESLVRRYSSLVYSVARKYGLDDDDVADVFQNTWCALWERLVEVRDQSRLSPWLITVAGRLSYQVIERRHRLAAREELDFDLESQPDSGAQTEDLAVAHDEAAQVRVAMTRLPDRCRQLLDYLFYDPDAPSYTEIARRLGVSPDTIGPLRQRCLRNLKILLDEAGID